MSKSRLTATEVLLTLYNGGRLPYPDNSGKVIHRLYQQGYARPGATGSWEITPSGLRSMTRRIPRRP